MSAEVIDLSQYRSGDEKPEVTPEQAEALKDMAASTAHDVLAGFVVWIDHSGEVNAASHLDVPLNPARPASASEMYGACAVVMKDIALQHTAQLAGEYATQGVVGNMMKAAQQAQASGLMSQIQRDPGLRNPKR